MMLLIQRIGIIAAASAAAVIAGLSVVFVVTPHNNPILVAPTAAIVPSAVPPAAPTAIVIAQAQPLTAVATSAPAPTLRPAITPVPMRSPKDILQQAEAAITHLHTGQLEAVIDYGNGDQSVANVMFDLGDALLPPKFAIATTYKGSSAPQIAQRITIDARTWQRQADTAWVSQPAQESVGGELQAFLPDFHSITAVKLSDGQEDLLALSWLNSNGADITLLIDPATNIPRQLRQRAADTGTLFTITYQSWNVPVEINPPG